MVKYRDQGTDEKDTWIDQSNAKREEEKEHVVTRTPSNSVSEKRPAQAKKAAKAEVVEETPDDAQEEI